MNAKESIIDVRLNPDIEKFSIGTWLRLNYRKPGPKRVNLNRLPPIALAKFNLALKDNVLINTTQYTEKGYPKLTLKQKVYQYIRRFDTNIRQLCFKISLIDDISFLNTMLELENKRYSKKLRPRKTVIDAINNRLQVLNNG